ncbi:hypothetical protein [Edaphobacter aggregans]|uniref:hypothetical protein n=1 Tax=Edaphobacter aggregans TaxID=570835 RepID=UPI0005500744|nr:hypothetical protein [Edaphobacter aggregans]
MREFDDLLDEVLKDRVAGKPRAGMEQRILARVREEGAQGFDWQRMGWIAGASLAACLVVGVVVELSQRRMDKNVVLPPQAASIPSTPARTNPTGEMPVPSPVKTTSGNRHAGRRVESVRVEAARPGDSQGREERLPKLDTFPAVTQKIEPLTVSPPAVAQAMQELKAKQEQPLVVAAIEIKPL